MVWRLNPRLVFVHCGGRKCDVSVKNVFHGPNYNSVWFRFPCFIFTSTHRHSCFDTTIQTDRCDHASNARTIPFLIKLLRPHFVRDIFPFANLPCLSSPHFLSSSISCRFQSTAPCLINDHHCAAGRTPPPKPSTNKVHEPRAWFCPMIQFKSREQSYA